jgi:hypothetical protein
MSIEKKERTTAEVLEALEQKYSPQETPEKKQIRLEKKIAVLNDKILNLCKELLSDSGKVKEMEPKVKEIFLKYVKYKSEKEISCRKMDKDIFLNQI